MVSGDGRIPHGDPRDGSVVVKLMTDSGQGGIYYLSKKTTVQVLSNMAGVGHGERFDQNMLLRRLVSGKTFAVKTQRSPQSLTLGEMDTAERIVLGLAMDQNRATVDDLMLIPGI